MRGMTRVSPTRLSEVGQHETVTIYPSFGCLDRDSGFWNIRVHGVIYEPAAWNRRKRILVQLLRRAMGASDLDLDSDIFRERISGFLVNHERGRRIVIQVGEKTYRLRRKSKRSGEFGGTLRLSTEDVHRLEEDGHILDGWLHFRVVTRGGDAPLIIGRCQLIGPSGISVISDIDDTVKHSEVWRRREMLVNTFLHQFDVVPGMSALYSQWAQDGAAFHYVSSSPWQLFRPLSELLEDTSFPYGTFHLRTLRLRDPRILALLLPMRRGKQRAIQSILKAFPDRRFVLVGDSGERDPEIYGAAARRYPSRVARIYIRDLAYHHCDPTRLQRAFRGISSRRWSVFREPAELDGGLI